ncbi:hypothetical protein A1O3_01241 [Capronia epimyces CBS 606.96]|uniref:DH domain-containing protein n=1 Tax=Capronia epimyces CBS 606.96 TaxID=1182542 RepID=W9ZDT8_9EURO|nr:uncharacterized protein A1O3_01241 [Capronia epimyces CBS 606.96]EXJ92689.1 hypothetical protein A1O3_01241 [Capronia epimyces CBS 606.96]
MRAESSPNLARRPPKSQQIEPSSPLRDHNVTPNRPSGLYDSGSVQDRIRQWQAQGAANAPAPDAVSIRSIPFSDCPSTVSRPKSEYGDENAIRREGRTRNKPPPPAVAAAAAEEEDQQHNRTVRSLSAPRKRIISDSRWKVKREAKDRETARSAPKIRPLSTQYDLSYTSNQEKRRERRRSHRQQNPDSDQASEQKPVCDDGIRVTALPPNQEAWMGEDGRLADVESLVDDNLARQLTAESTDKGIMDRYSETSIRPEEGDGLNRRRSKYVEMLGRAPTGPLDKDESRSRKIGLFGKTMDMFVKPDSAPSMDKRLPSIEAWLDEQPDPFVDGATLGEVPQVDVPRPLRKRTERRRSAEKSYIVDPNKIWDTIQPQQDSGEHDAPTPGGAQACEGTYLAGSHHGSPSTARDLGRDDWQDTEGSPSSLRRRGARHRRQRDSPRKKSSVHLEMPDESQIRSEEYAAPRRDLNPTWAPPRPCSPTGTYPLPAVASVETLTESQVVPAPQDSIAGGNCGLKRKLTTHEDLMSVLSQPRTGRSRRSVRNKRSTQETRHSPTVQEIVRAFMADEERYVRELRTLVDGVIPVLLQCVLSKTDSAAAAGLFTSSNSSTDQMSFTQPIIEMGIALERLKTLHSRVPGQDVDGILGWAQNAQRAYKDYIQAWRLGFEDIVINLAPLDSSKSSPTEQGMARDESGDVVDTEGKKVDVAYLLKRPLVRLKGLSKTFSRLRDECGKPLAARAADIYDDLTAMAKRRHHEEQTRLEDEAAANIDAMRVRDIRTMAAITGVVVNKSRRVKARDFFNLTLYHSTGQRMDCGVEMIFRDNARGDPAGGDVLICEVDDTGKWLLFAPVELASISARRGEKEFDLVVMIRGRAGLGQEWHELLALKTDDTQAVTEWMDMLGSNPLPPRLNRTSSFVKNPPASTKKPSKDADSSKQEIQSATLGPTDTPEALDVPLGEPSVIGSRTHLSQRSEHTRPLLDKPLPRLNLGGGLATKPMPQFHTSSAADTRHTPSFVSSDTSTISDRSVKATLTALSSPSNSALSKLEPPGKQSRNATVPPTPSQAVSPKTPPKEKPIATRQDARPSPNLRRTDQDSHNWMTSPTSRYTQPSKVDIAEPSSTRPQAPQPSTRGESTSSDYAAPVATPSRPSYQRALSSTPSKELPTVSKIRPQQQPPSPSAPAPSSRNSETPKSVQVQDAEVQAKQSRQHTKSSSTGQIFTESLPSPPPHTLRQGRPAKSVSASPQTGSPLVAPSVEKTAKRRTSSPLKHEYAPSTTSDSSSEYDSDCASDLSSDTSDALMSESGDKPTPLVAITAGGRRPSKPAGPPTSIPSTGARTLAPSDSASQGPYRRVPSSQTVPGHKKVKMIAMICSWSDKGKWEQIHPDECSIVISPGLIEAFEMSAAHSDPHAVSGAGKSDGPDSRTSSLAIHPLVAFELTPIVALRRGTAIDISIRSPPTPNSRIKTTSIVMFRSRNPEECEALYGMINWARCNNPTYIQLQNARPRRQPSVTFNVGQDSHSRSRSSSWFSFGSRQKSSYRASSAPTPASVDMSVESSGTMSSAFSALRRFGVSSAFNLNRSSVIRKNGNGGTGASLYSSSSGTGTGSGSSTPAPSQLGFVPGKDGPNVPSTSAAAANGGGMVNNMKIRLYVRKGQHWENLGAARLSVLPASTPAAPAATESRPTAPGRPGDSVEPSPPATPAHSRTPSNITPVIGQPGQSRGPRLASANHTPHRVHGNGLEKRLLLTRNKDPEAVLLDAVLGESCFERIMQTGIAVKVWTEDEEIGHTGGVTMGKETVYMMQFPGTKEATWVFGLCGTNRYAGASME